MNDASVQTEERTAEDQRLADEAARKANWKRWGPYLADRQWGTVREDYSEDGSCWEYFPHEDAPRRAYRWGEDGLLGFTDRQCRLCFGLALWNGEDPILKERLFGLTGPQGNHGEDVKEEYFFLESTPTHSYCKALYKYPQVRFPYEKLIEENARRSKKEKEFELADAGVFENGRYFDVTVTYAKAEPNDILIRVEIFNRSKDKAKLDVLPTLWFRNTWIWGCRHEGCTLKPRMDAVDERTIISDHESLGQFQFEVNEASDGTSPTILITENETNMQDLYGVDHYTSYVKDAFHRYVINGEKEAANPNGHGTKAAAHYATVIGGGESVKLDLRLRRISTQPEDAFGAGFDAIISKRKEESEAFYASRVPRELNADEAAIVRQGYAGLLWSKQFYHYVLSDWLEGDMNQPSPAESRKRGRNHDWKHLYNRDVISMPDKWEYPWFAAWDLAFHMIAFAHVDATFAKQQLMLFLREWYMHPNGQIPAYEFNFGDVNPPVHAWACWRVYKMTGRRGSRDRKFLASAFQKLLINFTWWVNRKDPNGNHLFSGGFLGLDNIGVFDRSHGLPDGGRLEQADATAWMAFYCGTMLSMAIELAREDSSYEDMASKFFEHFVSIIDAMNHLGGTGLWDEDEGFYYDQLHVGSESIRMKVRSMVGVIPLFAVEILHRDVIESLPGFKRRLDWFLKYRPDLGKHVLFNDERDGEEERGKCMLAIVNRERLEKVLIYLLDEEEFLSAYGMRSLSKAHGKRPYVLTCGGVNHAVKYEPGESESTMFGGNSNWRGPIWFPLNYLLIETLQRYHYFYGNSFKVECPKGSGELRTLEEVAMDLSRRLCSIFTRGEDGRRACHGKQLRFLEDKDWRELVLFHEYFHGETGEGLGAAHQTGWTALVVRCFEMLAGRS